MSKFTLDAGGRSRCVPHQQSSHNEEEYSGLTVMPCPSSSRPCLHLKLMVVANGHFGWTIKSLLFRKMRMPSYYSPSFIQMSESSCLFGSLVPRYHGVTHCLAQQKSINFKLARYTEADICGTQCA